MEQLIQKIKEKQDWILNQEFSKLEELKLLKNFYDNIDKNDLSSIASLENTEYILWTLRALLPDQDFKDHLELVNHFRTPINDIPLDIEDDFISIMNLIFDAIENDYLEVTIEALTSPANTSRLGLKKAFQNTDKKLRKHPFETDIKALMILIVDYFETPDSGIPFLKMFNGDKNISVSLLDSLFSLLDFKIGYLSLENWNNDDENTLDFEGKDVLTNKKLKIVTLDSTLPRKYRRLMDKDFKKSLLQDTNILKYINQITNYYAGLETEEQNFERFKQRTCTNHQLLLSNMERSLKYPIIKINKNLEKLLNNDEELKYIALSIIIEHNAKEYHRLKKENQSNENNSITQLEKLFFKYNLNINSMKFENRLLLLQLKSIEEVEEILKSLNTHLFSFLNVSDPYYIDILLYSNSTIINEIETYFKQGIIPSEFICEHIGILIPDHDHSNQNIKPLYSSFKKNIQSLEQYRIQWETLTLQQLTAILLGNNNLQILLPLLNNFYIPVNQKASNIFIQYPQLIDYIDNYIELGLYDLLLEQPEILIKNPNIIKRIIILKSINISIPNSFDKLSNNILTGKNFYIADEKLDEYIINHIDFYIDSEKKTILEQEKCLEISQNTLEHDLIGTLEKEQKINNLIYQFNGIMISRPKVLKYFELLNQHFDDPRDNLFTSIIFNSYLSGEQIEQIKEELNIKKQTLA